MFGWFKKKKPEAPSIDQEEDCENLENCRDVSVERVMALDLCKKYGFKPAESLPHLKENLHLRPSIEIAKRLNAIKAIVLWLMVPEENLPNEILLNFVNANGLKQFLTNEEATILDSARDNDELRNMIGWKFENAWPLAWYFGYEVPDVTGIMMEGDQMQIILKNFSCPLNMNIEEWLKTTSTVSEDEVVLYEDIFYCIHNAVRGAQLGGDTIPEGFHPIGNGGVIHERRHSLTWMLSIDTKWEDTDLST